MNLLWANVDRDGIITFEKHAAEGLVRLPVIDGEAEKVVAVVKRWANLDADGFTYKFNNIAKCYDQMKQVDLLVAWRKILQDDYDKM